MKRSLALFAVTLACAGTPPRAFQPDAPLGTSGELAPVVERVSATHADPVPAVVLALPPAPAHGFRAHELPSGRELWHTDAAIDVRPIVLGDLVLSHVDDELVAWNTQDGRERFRVSDRDLKPVGAAR